MFTGDTIPNLEAMVSSFLPAQNAGPIEPSPIQPVQRVLGVTFEDTKKLGGSMRQFVIRDRYEGESGVLSDGIEEGETYSEVTFSMGVDEIHGLIRFLQEIVK